MDYETPGYTEYGNQMDPDKNEGRRQAPTAAQKLANQLNSLKKGNKYQMRVHMQAGKGAENVATGLYQNGKIGTTLVDQYKQYRIQFRKA